MTKYGMGAFTIQRHHSIEYSLESLSLMLRHFFSTEKKRSEEP